MSKQFNPTWKNIIILIIIFYVIGDVLLAIRIRINKEIKKYNDRQSEIRMMEYKKNLDTILYKNNLRF